MYIRAVFLLTLVLSVCNLSAQKSQFTAAESASIHDSILKSRWDAGGRLSQYSFRYMSEFFPVGIIEKSENVYKFESHPKKPIAAISVNSKTGKLTFDEYLKKLHVTSFIVVHKGRIVYEQYFSALPQDRQTLQSINKVITSALITNLANEKKIDLEQPIEKYIPDLTGTDWQGISVKNILNMRSGMDSKSIDFASGPFTNPEHKNYQLESALGILPKAENTPKSVYEFIKNLKKEKAAGLAAEYSNINTFVLGWLAENVSGKKYADLVSERIWKQMGASSDAYVCLSDKGIAWPHGGISCTLRDLARFGMLFTNSEIRDRKESLISFKQLQEIFDAKPIDSPIAPFKWAYQWDWASDGILMKGGFGGQALYVHPQKEIVIAYFNFPDKDWAMDNMISQKVLTDILDALDTR
ncbi:serine hydrolase [Flavobacterium sp.]|uniref:serine hydrolase domain-containing protein n=1 Tax=Flavobacterium sp. TaxID=239 RepID=UPI00120CADDE|nr:serine hydrolase domain-containing protein [Flavobacterium sp.]RZJ72395.1 MAG: class A beta-lactamase-related serine hydrolase [Flavobacterium sp.]